MGIQKELFETDLDDYIIICRPWITLRNGKRLHAKDVGKSAFCFKVKRK